MASMLFSYAPAVMLESAPASSEHVADKRRFFGEARRVLRAGGPGSGSYALSGEEFMLAARSITLGRPQ